MLIDLDFHADFYKSNDMITVIDSFNDGTDFSVTVSYKTGKEIEVHTYYVSHRIQEGVYETGLNFDSYIGLWTKYKTDFMTCKYGVADTIDQILEYHADFISGEAPQVLSVCRIKRDEQGESGWRWHKWGQYIGTQEPTTEYIKDEPVIEEVLVYSIYNLEIK